MAKLKSHYTRNIHFALSVWFFLFLLILWNVVEAKTTYPTMFAEYVRNYDGDTLTVNIKWASKKFDIFNKEIGVRINGIDTPEINGKGPCEKKKAKEAKEFVRRYLTPRRGLVLRKPHRGKFFRVVADVYVDSINLAKLLLDKGLAVHYDGGTKPRINWCKIKKRK